jgi:hypothetical protein
MAHVLDSDEICAYQWNVINLAEHSDDATVVYSRDKRCEEIS